LKMRRPGCNLKEVYTGNLPTKSNETCSACFSLRLQPEGHAAFSGERVNESSE
jgi:hypothetical protein